MSAAGEVRSLSGSAVRVHNIAPPACADIRRRQWAARFRPDPRQIDFVGAPQPLPRTPLPRQPEAALRALWNRYKDSRNPYAFRIGGGQVPCMYCSEAALARMLKVCESTAGHMVRYLIDVGLVERQQFHSREGGSDSLYILHISRLAGLGPEDIPGYHPRRMREQACRRREARAAERERRSAIRADSIRAAAKAARKPPRGPGPRERVRREAQAREAQAREAQARAAQAREAQARALPPEVSRLADLLPDSLADLLPDSTAPP